LDGVTYEDVLYEGYGNNGVAIMCEVLTDNRNRTAAEIRKIFENKGGSLGASGCVAWIFHKKGLLIVEAGEADEETIMELAIEAGADDFETVGQVYEITCSVENFQTVKKALQEKEIPIQLAEMSQIPSNSVTLDENGARKILALMDALEDQDDVQNVSGNFDIPDDILKKFED